MTARRAEPPRARFCSGCGHSNRSHNELAYCQVGQCSCGIAGSTVRDEDLTPLARRRRDEAVPIEAAWIAWRNETYPVRGRP